MMLLRSFIPPLGMLLLSAGQGGTEELLIDRSEIRFGGRHAGRNVDGRFRRWKANVVFLPKHLSRSKAELDVDLSSMDLANDEIEAELKRPEWLDTGAFPMAHFESTSIRSLGQDRYEVHGKLTIKGLTRDVSGPVVLKKDAAGNNVAEGSFPLRRADFDIGDDGDGAPPLLASEVTIRLRLVLPPVK